jgi:hypothetical protein
MTRALQCALSITLITVIALAAPVTLAFVTPSYIRIPSSSPSSSTTSSTFTPQTQQPDDRHATRLHELTRYWQKLSDDAHDIHHVTELHSLAHYIERMAKEKRERDQRQVIRLHELSRFWEKKA